MSLEEALKANTAALEANTAALKAGGKASSGGASTGSTPYKAKHTHEEMKAALTKVKDTISQEACFACFKPISGAEKTKDITDPEIIDKCYDAAMAKLAEHAKAQQGSDI